PLPHSRHVTSVIVLIPYPSFSLFSFTHTPTTKIYTLSLHDALPISKKIRKEGKVPGVVYGKGKESKSIAIDGLDLMKKLREAGRNAIIRLEIESDSPVDVMLHEYQMDPIKNDLLHVDFYV